MSYSKSRFSPFLIRRQFSPEDGQPKYDPVNVSNAFNAGAIPFQKVQVQEDNIKSYMVESITANKITAGILIGFIIKTAQTVDIFNNGVVLDEDGIRGYSDTLGLVFNIPTDGSAPTFSSGVINNTIFEINTNAILRTSETVGDGSADSAGILVNSSGLYACEANQLLEDANIRILVDGTAVIQSNVRGGQTDFNTGIGYFLGLSAGAYKLSIGDPDSNYLTWDGTYLRIKGSIDVGTGGLINNSVYTVANLPSAPTVVGYNVPSAYE